MILSAIVLVLQIGFELLKLWTGWDKKRQEERKAVIEHAKESIKSRDVSLINLSIQRINRMR